MEVETDSEPVTEVESSLDLEETEDSTEDEIDETYISHNPDFEKATMETVGAILHKILETPVRPQFKNTAAMFNDLRDMCTWLPEGKKETFLTSLDRLKLDYVINRLMGKPGLLAAAGAVRNTGGLVIDNSSEKPSLLKTMTYMRDLSSNLPDKNVAIALSNAIDDTVIPGLSLSE